MIDYIEMAIGKTRKARKIGQRVEIIGNINIKKINLDDPTALDHTNMRNPLKFNIVFVNDNGWITLSVRSKRRDIKIQVFVTNLIFFDS